VGQFSIAGVGQFSTAGNNSHGISRATFYNLIKRQLAPRLMKVGKRTLISVEAAAEWRAQMEKTSTEGK